MTVFDYIIKDDVKNFFVCHRVEYNLWGEESNKTIDIMTTFDYPLNDVVENTPQKVIDNANECINIMNSEYISEIPDGVVPFTILKYTIITSTGEEIV